MSKVFDFARSTTPTPRRHTAPEDRFFSFSKEVEGDTKKLADSLSISPEEAVKVAADFYRKYPMLMEHVRSPEYMLRNN